MSGDIKKLFLLDAYALIYRAYYAFIKNPRINSKGLNTSAMLGFTNTLLDVINNQHPTHIAVVFDTPGPTERDVIFPAYKANREATPEDIQISIPYIKKIIEAFNISIIESSGYEADDIIGTLVKKAEGKGFTTYMMTPDKDFGQLVSEKTFIFKPAKGGNKPEIIGVREVCEKYGISHPNQLIDILGLWGDAVDNIPGVPGVGEKTASKLIGEFDSIENLLANTDQLKGKLKEKVESNKDQALLSKKLASIILDAPIELDEAALLVKEPDKEGLKEIFRELEFRQLIDRMYRKVPQDQKPADIIRKPKDQPDLFSQFEEENETSNGPSDKKNITLVNHQYHLMDSEEKIIKLTDLLGKNSFFTFDTETTGLNPHLAELVGIAFSLNPGEAYYVPFPESFNEAKKRSSAFKPLFENPNIEKIGQNIKYDIAVLRKYDISVKGKLFDTMIAHYLLRPDMRHNMNILSETYLDYAPIPIDTLIGKKGKGQKSIREAPLEQVCEYACEDADITLQLKDAFGPMLKKEGLLSLFNDIETPLINVLETMEHNGVSIDTDLLSALSGELEEDIRILEGEIQLLAGQSFNVDSPKQLGEVLFEMLKIDEKPKKTKTGQYSTSEDVLSKLVHKHDIIPKILDFRTLRKLKSTYVDTLPNMINPVTQRIHARFNQAVAATGRLSSDKPNLQNIPIKTQRGREVRKAFIPSSKENIILAADYSQIELRIIAELSKDPSMMEAFSNGTDIHKATAANIFGLPLSEVTRELRTKAKAVNFGISYGQTAFGLSQTLDISRKEAKEIIDNFFNKYSKIKTYMTNNIEFARSKGYVETLLGRKRYLRDINSRNAIVRGHAERNAINAPIQGTAADMIKIAMVNIHQEMAKTGIRSQLIMQVHDELVFEVHKDELEELSSLVESQMKNAIPMKVPIEIDLGTGKNWLAAH